MTKARIFIDGEAGTTGLQIRARLADRDDMEVVSIAHDLRKNDAERARLLNSVDLAVLCLPDDAAKSSVAMIENPAVKVLDASSAHRTTPGWTYGFPELTKEQPEAIRTASRVANPGCYPTGALALIRPLVEAQLLPADLPVSVQALEGYTGGGRQLIDAFEGRGPNPINDPARLYALELMHKHVPEMHMYSGLTYKPLFTPIVGDYQQGELVQVPLHLRTLPADVTGRKIHAAIDAHFAGQRFVTVMPFEPRPVSYLSPDTLNGTNRMELFVFENSSSGHVLLVARLDNLGKGASGAAAQNIDLMLGLSGEHNYDLAQ